MKPLSRLTNFTISIVALLTWLLFFQFLKADNKGKFSKFGFSDIGPIQTLKRSSLARGMFIDIGILSTIISGWIVTSSKLKIKYIFAIPALFLGSLVILPFLGLKFLFKSLTPNNARQL